MQIDYNPLLVYENMRTSHLIFIGVCLAWVTIVLAYPSELKEEVGYARTAGQAVGSLIIPGMIYGAYLFLTRNKQTTLKKTSV